MSGAPRFFTLDAFTREKFSGVPLAIIENADALRPQEMQLLAREFNLPATVFLGAPRDPSNSARLRLFAPEGPRAFAAEALVGAATLLAQTRAPEILARGDLAVALELGDEVWRCEAIRNRDGICYAEFALKQSPQPCEGAPAAAALAQGLGLAPDDIGFGAHAPCAFCAFERTIFAPMRTRDALLRACPQPGFDALLGEASGLFLYANETLALDAAIEARLFGLAGENAAGGEALAGFAGAACEFERPEDGEHQIFVDQSHSAGRRSRLTLRLSVAGGALAESRLGGQAVVVAQGELSP